MKLLTKAILERFEKVGGQEKTKDPLVIVKFFNPCGAGTWWATEYFPEEQLFFGFVSIFGDHNDEWGYFSMEELKAYRHHLFGLGIERDMHFKEQPASQVKRILAQSPWLVEE